MKKKGIIAVIGVVFLAVVSWLLINRDRESQPVISANYEEQASKQDSPKELSSSGFSPETFEQLQEIDKETIRELVQKVRRLGAPQATPVDCSLLTLEDAHFAIASFWDPEYMRDSSTWKTSGADNLWDPSLKEEISKPGAWMVAMLTKSEESKWQGVVLRWDAPPGKTMSPPVSLSEPIAQACNSGWNELLKQNYAFFSFVKVTAVQNRLQMHFTVVKNEQPQRVVVTVPINGTYASWSLGDISIQDE